MPLRQIGTNFKNLDIATFDFLTYVKGHFAYFYGYFIPPQFLLK